jgi:hypothetical protein
MPMNFYYYNKKCKFSIAYKYIVINLFDAEMSFVNILEVFSFKMVKIKIRQFLFKAGASGSHLYS